MFHQAPAAGRTVIHDENAFGKPAAGVSLAAGAKRLALTDIQNTLRTGAAAPLAARKAELAPTLGAHGFVTKKPETSALASALQSHSSTAAPASAASAAGAASLALPAFSKPMPGSKRPLPPNVFDIDVDGDAVANIPAYAQDIACYLADKEARDFVSPNYMASQKELTPQLRGALFDYLSNFHLHLRLQPDTLHLAYRYIDMYLSVRGCTRQMLRVVGVVALFIACKVEEMYSPEMRQFAKHAAVADQDIVVFERHMLAALKWNVTVPTVYPFIQRFLKAAPATREVQMLAHFLAELSLHDVRMLKYAPSQLAAGCLYAAIKAYNTGSWTSTLEYYSQYNEAAARACAVDVIAVRRAHNSAAFEYNACFGKYSSTKFCTVAQKELPTLL